ncbi:MAG: ATP-binding protein [Rhabdochlamydiaceae bacterium]
MFYKRTLTSKLQLLKNQFPVLAIFGPRQSGKTTLARSLFSSYKYINLESMEQRLFAQEDPKGFLKMLENEEGVIFDEIQKTPQLLSYLQLEVDEKHKSGQFIITGSQNLLLNQQVSQTLAGRVALTTLLPFSVEELREAKALPDSANQTIFQGFYPRIYDQHTDPVVFSESYERTYVERDVRDIKQITDLAEFQKFMRLCAGRIGQLLNLSSLATEAGISLATVKSWLSVLEACYIIFLLQPYHRNFNKRVVKMPKLYFYDTALACHLLRISSKEDVFEHYLRGGLFESMVISDFLKKRLHHALPPNLYFWRDKNGNEVDLLLEEGSKLIPIEIKSTSTLNNSLFENLTKWSEISEDQSSKGILVYAGSEHQKREKTAVISWSLL